MKKILILILILSIISCDNKVDVTKTEINAVQQVLNFYNGKCLRKKGFTVGTKGNKKSFILEMQESDLLEKNYDLRNYHSANIAYLFYSNLKNEKQNYDFIETKIIYNNGKEFKAKYSIEILNEIEELMPNFNKITEILINTEYDKLKDLFDKSISFELTEENNPFKILDEKYGKITKTQFQGFETIEDKNYGKLIVFNAVTIRKNAILPIKIIFKRNNGKLISIEFD